jgi:hypothetical protein
VAATAAVRLIGCSEGLTATPASDHQSGRSRLSSAAMHTLDTWYAHMPVSHMQDAMRTVKEPSVVGGTGQRQDR